MLGAGAHQFVADLVDLRHDLLVQVDEFVQTNAVTTDLVECLDEFGPDHGRVFAVDPDHLQRLQPLECAGVVDESVRLGQRHRLRLLGGPGTHDRRLEAEDVAQVLTLFPRAEHFPDVRDVVSAVEHRGDQPQPGQVSVVEQCDAPDAQWRRQQATVAVHPDIARGGAGQPGQVIDPVLTGRGHAVGVADGGVEKL